MTSVFDRPAIGIYYLDASALIKILIEEPRSEAIREFFSNESAFFTTSVCFAEVLGILKRKQFKKKKIIEYFDASAYLMGFVNDHKLIIDEVQISQDDIFTEVEAIARRHSIDISDAFQLVTIQRRFSLIDKEAKFLITADRKLAKAARKEGVKAWYCMKEKAPQ
jgi:predicted nucleic acid-binding protein